MTDKELRRLSRRRLLEMLAEQTGKAERLERENERLKTRIAEREQHLSQMGELTEAILHGGTLDPEKESLASEYLGHLREAGGGDGETEEEEEEPPSSIADWPTRAQLLAEARRESGRQHYMWSLRTTVYAMITVAAAGVLIAVLVLPVFQIYGTSMDPTLNEGDVVVGIKGGKTATGDLVAFYYNNKILVKRVIGRPGQWVDMDKKGNVYVDNKMLEEGYLADLAYGEGDVKLPYQVPENRVFVMGDNRSVSIDSRYTSVGCIPEEQVVGKVVFRIWPLKAFGKM